MDWASGKLCAVLIQGMFPSSVARPKVVVVYRRTRAAPQEERAPVLVSLNRVLRDISEGSGLFFEAQPSLRVHSFEAFHNVDGIKRGCSPCAI